MTSIKSGYRIGLERQFDTLSAQLAGLDAEASLKKVICDLFPNKSCIVSSFGTESVAVLHMVSRIDPNVPVIFLDTEKLFPETHEYKSELVESLGLTNIVTLRPNPHDLQADDPDGALHATDANLCCYVRKALPLIRALRPYELWVTGRKRSHGGERAALPNLEVQDGKLKLNPLFDWDTGMLRAYMDKYNLPDHPLRKFGYLSVGCMPCTQPVTDLEAGPRSGRWADQDKTECGIHVGADGKFVRNGGI